VPSHVGSAGILHQEASIFGNAPTQALYDVDSSAAHHLLLPHDQETCSLYKIAMSQQLYFEVRFAEHSSTYVAYIQLSNEGRLQRGRLAGRIEQVAIATVNIETSKGTKVGRVSAEIPRIKIERALRSSAD